MTKDDDKGLGWIVTKLYLQELGKCLIPLTGDICFHKLVKEYKASKFEKVIREYGFYTTKYAFYGYVLYKISEKL